MHVTICLNEKNRRKTNTRPVVESENAETNQREREREREGRVGGWVGGGRKGRVSGARKEGQNSISGA